MAGIIVEHNWEKEMAKSYGRLKLFLAKQLGDGSVLANLHSDAPVDTYPVAGTLEIDGVLFVKRSAEKRPRWGSVLDEAAGRVIPDLANRSSSAVLLLRVDGDIFAFAFGYARVAAVAMHDARKARPRHELHDLREQGLSNIHGHSSGVSTPRNYLAFENQDSNRHQMKSTAIPRQCSLSGLPWLI